METFNNTFYNYPITIMGFVGHDYGLDLTRPHMVCTSRPVPPVVVSDPESHDLETDKQEVTHLVRLKPPDEALQSFINRRAHPPFRYQVFIG